MNDKVSNVLKRHIFNVQCNEMWKKIEKSTGFNIGTLAYRLYSKFLCMQVWWKN